jgi:xanthine dehydrogenase accessory factor
LLRRHATVARVTIAALAGSAPRETGATLVVDARGGIAGTIGGGRLEWLAVRAARELLREHAALPPVRLIDWTLGPQLGQCCGGRVTVWLERLTRDDAHWLAGTPSDAFLSTSVRDGVLLRELLPARNGAGPATGASAVTLNRESAGRVTLIEAIEPPRPRLWLFGAGHVGQALVRLLAGLDAFDLTWIDSRAAILPRDLPDGVVAQAATAPAELVPQAAAGTRYLVMTHDHGLDYELCRVILERGDAAWLGLIGSASKAARFRSRLLRDGVPPAALSTLTCPIGVPGIAGKQPAAIAVAIAADLLQRLATSEAAAAGPKPAGPAPMARPPASATACTGADCATCGTGVSIGTYKP